MFPLEFREVNRKETSHGDILTCREDRMIVPWVILTRYRTVMDGRSDGQTDCRTNGIYHILQRSA